MPLTTLPRKKEVDIMVEIRSENDPEAMRLEYEIYLDEEYIDPNPRKIVLENRVYPAYQHLVASAGGRAVGAARLVTDMTPRESPFSLNCFRPFEIHTRFERELRKTPFEKILQVGTVVIRREYRGGETFQALFRTAMMICAMKRIRYAVSTVDEAVFNRFNRRGFGLHAMGPAKFYMGSVTVPVLVDIQRLLKKTTAENTEQAEKEAV